MTHRCFFFLMLCSFILWSCDIIPEPDPIDPEFGTNRFDSRKRETALGSMICDGILWSFNQAPPDARPADFSILNGGIFEFGLPKGEISAGMIPGMLKSDILTSVDLQGRDVKALFEELAAIPIGANAWAQVSQEVQFTINWTNGMGQVRELKIKGQDIAEDALYRLVTGHVLVWGKPNSHIDRYYDTLHALETANPACARKIGEKTCTEAVMEYVDSRVQPYIPEIDGRILIEK